VLLSCTDHLARATAQNAKTTTNDDDDDVDATSSSSSIAAVGILLGKLSSSSSSSSFASPLDDGGGGLGGGKEGHHHHHHHHREGGGGGGGGIDSMTTMMTHSISNCFEISSAPLSGTGVVVDEEFVKRMRSNYKQTFPDLEAVGWYWCSVENGKEEEEEEEKTKKEIHEQIKECVKDAVDCPMVLLTVDAKVRGRERSPGSALPAKLFRFEETDRTFKAISYAIDASPAERVAADHASKATERTELETKESRVLAYLMERRVGVKALRDRVGTMLEFLEKEVRGENDTEDDRARFEIMRRLNAVCAQKDTQLPNEETANREKSDAALLETLTKLTKACAETESFARRFNCAYKYKKEDVLDASAEADGVGGFAMEHFDHRAPLTTAGGATKPRAFSTTRRSSRRQQHAAAGVGTTSMQID
tara:strand:+ start:648 stop:1910 length:1263 start_codon:yes stop_codon:yes gene_type:complete